MSSDGHRDADGDGELSPTDSGGYTGHRVGNDDGQAEVVHALGVSVQVALGTQQPDRLAAAEIQETDGGRLVPGKPKFVGISAGNSVPTALFSSLI